MPRRSFAAEIHPNLRSDNTIRLAARCEGRFSSRMGSGRSWASGCIRRHQESSAIIAAVFSPIMIVGAWVQAFSAAGMIEASGTHRGAGAALRGCIARPQRRDRDDGCRLAETVPVSIEGPDGGLLDTGSGLISCRLAE